MSSTIDGRAKCHSLPTSPVAIPHHRRSHSDETGRNRTEKKVYHTVQAFNLPLQLERKSKMQKTPLSKEDFIKKYLKTFKDYLEKYGDLFFYITETEHKENYLEHCESCYRRYYDRMTTCNDPGTVL